MEKISEDYFNHSAKMKLRLDKWEHPHWNILFEAICNKEYPLRELELLLVSSYYDPIETCSIELAEIIESNTTLTKFDYHVNHISLDTKKVFYSKD